MIISLRPRLSFVWFAVLLNLAIVLPLAFYLNLWLDEAWTMQTTANGAARAFFEAVREERQAPLYFVLLAIWRVFDNSLFWARMFSVGGAIAAIFTFDALLKRFRVQNKWFVLFFAVHPFLLYAALEARVYALVILLSALLLLFWVEGYADQQKREKQFFYVLLSVSALYTNYYLGFLLVAHAVALVVLKSWSALKNYLWQMCVVAVLAAPLFFIIRNQFAANSDYFHAVPTVFDGLKIVWNVINEFLLPSPEIKAPLLVRWWLVRLGLLSLSIIFLQFVFKKFVFKSGANNKFDSPTFALGAICAVVGAFFMAAYFLVGPDYLQLRHAAPLFVPLTLLLFIILERILVFPALVLTFFYLSANLVTYAPLAKRGDWGRIARFIQNNEQANEPVALFRIYDALPFRFYYRGSNIIVPPAVSHDWNPEAAEGSMERWRRQTEFFIAQIPPAHNRLWLITGDFCDVPETMNECRPLEDFVRENYVVESTKNFYTRKVRLLRRKTN